jgi:Adenosine deaminase z-alpha domain
VSHDFINAKKLAARITVVKEELAKLLHLQSFLGTTAKRGRKSEKPVKSTGKRGKRGKVKQTVLAYLEKRKEGKASAIAKESGLKLGSINQVLFALKKDGTVTQDKKRGSPFVLARK